LANILFTNFSLVAYYTLKCTCQRSSTC